MSDYSLNDTDTGLVPLYGKASNDEIDTDSLELNPVTKIQNIQDSDKLSSFNNIKSSPSQTSDITNMQSPDEQKVRFHLDEDKASNEDASFPVTYKKSFESPPVQSPTSSKSKESGILRVKIGGALDKGDDAPNMSTENLKNLKIDDASANDFEATQSASPPDLEDDNLDSIEENFRIFAKFGDPKSNGKLITLSNSDKWMKQAKIIDGKKVTTTDTGIYFKKLKAQKVPVTQYRTFLEDLAKAKKIAVQDIIKKLASCGVPGFHGAGNVKSTDAVNRLTDASKYTGTHKQRFDDSGKGKGIAGRKDMVDTSGYVSGYQNKDTFEGRESK